MAEALAELEVVTTGMQASNHTISSMPDEVIALVIGQLSEQRLSLLLRSLPTIALISKSMRETIGNHLTIISHHLEEPICNLEVLQAIAHRASVLSCSDTALPAIRNLVDEDRATRPTLGLLRAYLYHLRVLDSSGSRPTSIADRTGLVAITGGPPPLTCNHNVGRMTWASTFDRFQLADQLYQSRRMKLFLVVCEGATFSNGPLRVVDVKRATALTDLLP